MHTWFTADGGYCSSRIDELETVRTEVSPTVVLVSDMPAGLVALVRDMASQVVCFTVAPDLDSQLCSSREFERRCNRHENCQEQHLSLARLVPSWPASAAWAAASASSSAGTSGTAGGPTWATGAPAARGDGTYNASMWVCLA